MSSFLMNSGYSGVDPKFPPSDDYNQSSYLGSHSEYYNHMQAAQHYGYNATAAAAMSGYPNPRDPMGYSNYYQQCGGMTAQQVSIMTKSSPKTMNLKILNYLNLHFHMLKPFEIAL